MAAVERQQTNWQMDSTKEAGSSLAGKPGQDALFDEFVSANTFRSILNAFGNICVSFDLDPSNHATFYAE